jgi:UDP-N-acetylglucosamine 3-dehydrogenase
MSWRQNFIKKQGKNEIMIKVGVIGVGSMGQNHARVFAQSEDAELLAVADYNEEQAERIGKKYNVAAFSDYREMFRDVEAVSIAVPTSFHKEIALEAISRGIHVLVEKPIANSAEDAKEMITAAADKGVKLMIGHIERFNPAIIELKKRLADLGEIYKIDVQRIGPFPGRITDVGVIVDLSVHDIDIISFLIGANPTRIYAESQQKLHPDHEDSVTALIRYGNEVKATLTINYLSPTKIRQLQIFGKKGMFQVNYLNQELFFYENPGYSMDSWESMIEGDMRKINLDRKEPLQAEIEAFIDCIKQDTKPPVSGEQGLQVLEMAHHILASAKENKIIEL